MDELRTPPFWTPPDVKTKMFRQSLLFELVCMQAHQAIMEVCRILVFDISSDDFDTSSSDDSSSD